MAAAILLPTLGLTSAAGATPPPNAPSAATMKARADADSAAGFARIKAGKPASFDECAALATKPKKGVVPCSRPSTPDEINPAEQAAMLADIDRQFGTPAPEPAPVEGEAATAYAVAPGSGPPKTMICPSDGTRFEGRMKSCSIYNWTTSYVAFGTNGAQTIGQSFQTAVEWDQLSSTSRSWTHHLTVRVHDYSWGDAMNGIYVWTTMRCSFPCSVSNESGGWAWVWMPKSVNFYGSGTLGADLAGSGDYFDHNANIYTRSPQTSSGLYATALTNSPDQIRCETTLYVSTSKAGGCAYWRQPGYLRLSLSDPTITESARFVYQAQGYLPTHPGVMGWVGLTRATPEQKAANEAARRGPCDALRAAFVDPTPSVAKDCDEYPFQATAQGAASGPMKVSWDAKILNAEQNQKVGSMLSSLYATERFLYGDHFYVQFTL